MPDKDWLRLDGFLQAARDKPGIALCVAAGTGLALGLMAGPWIFSASFGEKESTKSERRHSKRGDPEEYRAQESLHDFDIRSRDNLSISGSSTPASTITSGSSMSFLSKQLDDKLDYSLALVYRHDLALGKGRLVALCAQAALGQFKKLWKGKDEDLKLWEKGAKKKLCLEAQDEAHLTQVEIAATRDGLPTFKVKDVSGSGRRFVAVMAIGPAKTSRIQDATADLKQLL